MKLAIAQPVLNGQLSITQQLIGRGGFAYLAFDASGDELTIKAANNEGNLSITTECDILEEGSVCIHTNKLTELVKLLHGEISIKTGSNGRVAITDSRKDSFKIATLERSMFMELPDPDVSGLFVVPSELMRQAIDSVAFALPHGDNERFTMRCARLVLDMDGQLFLTTTDGQRIVKASLALPEEPLDELDLLIPDRALHALHKICGHGDSVRIAQDETRIYFEAGNIHYSTTKLVGSFPDTDKAADGINKDYTTVIVNRHDFHDAMKKASLITDNRSVKLEMVEDTMYVRVESEDGSADIALSMNGKLKLTILMNVRFVLEFLETIKGEGLAISFKNPTALVQFAPENVKYLLAPMRM